MKVHHQASRWVLVATLSLGALGAYAASGYKVTPMQESQVKVGMTTTEVQSTLGRPARITKYRNEVGPTWTYDVSNASSDHTVYEIDFSPEGKVIKMNERTHLEPDEPKTSAGGGD